MEFIKMGKNTGKVEIKLPNEVKKDFEKYVKDLAFLKPEEVPTAELVMASWLASFKNSEEYKTVIDGAVAKKKNDQAEKDAKKAQARAKREEDAEKKRLDDLKKLRNKIAELEAKGQKAEEADAQAEAQAEAQADAKTEE